MKLNPPKTAPKDGTLILVSFYRCKIVPAVWDAVVDCWVCAFVNHQKSKVDIEGLYREDSNLRGWLPMPTIDDEGNVT